MLSVFVLEQSAEARSRLISRWTGHLNQAGATLGPGRVSLNSASFAELSLLRLPEVVVLGPELVAGDVLSISRARRIAPQAHLIVVAPPPRMDLTSTEEFLRLGADDVVTVEISALELQRKITILLRRSCARSPGKLLLVLGAKGGVGTTSVAAAVADGLLDRYERVCIVDTDVRTQSLTRYLRVRPVVNESLQLILTGDRPPTKENIDQTATPLGSNENVLACVAPIPDEDRWYDSHSGVVRMCSVYLENLAEDYDVVVVDCAGVRGLMLRNLVRAADAIGVVTSGDPAGLYSLLTVLRAIAPVKATSTPLSIVQSGSWHAGLTLHHLRSEVASVFDSSLSPSWSAVGDDRAVRAWPGSGATPFGSGGRNYQRAIRTLIDQMLGGAEAKVMPQISQVEVAQGLRKALSYFGYRGTAPAAVLPPTRQIENLTPAVQVSTAPSLNSLVPAVLDATQELLRVSTGSGFPLKHSEGACASATRAIGEREVADRFLKKAEKIKSIRK